MIHKENSRVIIIEKIAENIFRTVFLAPNIARETHPGQFIMLAPRAEKSILNRPMAIYDVDEALGTLTIGYHVIGPNTDKYAALAKGDEIMLIGPMGAQFLFDLSYDRYFLIGGGIGITSLHLIGTFLASQGKQITTLIGARHKGLIACEEDFKKFGEVKIATDDGSTGHKGFVHELLNTIVAARLAPGVQGRDLSLPNNRTQAIYCGPHAMMKSCADVCENRKISHLAVMEEMMACGVGICVACVCQTQEGQKKVCIDGPIFEGSKIQWTREQTSILHE